MLYYRWVSVWSDGHFYKKIVYPELLFEAECWGLKLIRCQIASDWDAHAKGGVCVATKKQGLKNDR